MKSRIIRVQAEHLALEELGLQFEEDKTEAAAFADDLYRELGLLWLFI